MIAFKTFIQLILLSSTLQLSIATPTQPSPQAQLFKRDNPAGCYDDSYLPPLLTECNAAFEALPFNQPDLNGNILLDSSNTTVTSNFGTCQIRIQCNNKPVQASRLNLYGVPGQGGYQSIRDTCLANSKAGSATVTGGCTVRATVPGV